MSIDADLNAGVISESEARKEDRKYNKKLISMVLWMVLLNLLKVMHSRHNNSCNKCCGQV